MHGKHTERAFEDAIEHSLITAGGWTKGDASGFDRERAIASAELFAFIEATQADLWAELKKQNGIGLEAAVLEALIKSIDSRGTRDVLRHGFKFYGKRIACAYFRPAHGRNPEIIAKYGQNRLVVTRQIHVAPTEDRDEDKSIDVMLSLNGLPIATAEPRSRG